MIKYLIILLALCLQTNVYSQTTKTKPAIITNEAIYILTNSDGSTETFFIKNKDVWYTSTKTKKKEKLTTIKYVKHPGHKNSGDYEVSFLESPTAVCKLEMKGQILVYTNAEGTEQDCELFDYNFKGTVGSSIIYLLIDGNSAIPGGQDESFNGFYIYDSSGSKITLEDGISFFSAKGPSDIEFKESYKGKKTGNTFTIVNPNFDDNLKLSKEQFGTWSNKDNSKELQIILKKI